MISLIKILSTEVDKLNRRVGKFLRFGNKDVQTSLNCAPFGIDSNPIKDMVAIFAPTTDKGETVIIGYINKNQIAGVGEFRVFSTDQNGALKAFIWLKNDGTIQLGGDNDFLVRFNALEQGFNQFKSDFNGHSHTGHGAPPTTPTTASISDAKISQIKTL